MLWFAFSSFTFVDRLQQKSKQCRLGLGCDLLSVLLHLWIDYNLFYYLDNLTQLWFAFSSFTFVDRLQLKQIACISVVCCDLLSVLLHLWIDYNANFKSSNDKVLWFAFSSFTFVDRLQLWNTTLSWCLCCDLLSVLLHLWIDYNSHLIVGTPKNVVICFQFFYICG